MALAVAAVLFVSCSDDDGPATRPGPEAGTPSRPDPYSGDCTSARWADVSDACWSCICAGCAGTLNACREGCIGIMQCALAEKTLVGDLSEIACEVRATVATCSPGGRDDSFDEAAAFDTCLITAPKPTEGPLRLCEAECGITYTGDVCERFPEPDAGAP